jgi:hypothetical protein
MGQAGAFRLFQWFLGAKWERCFGGSAPFMVDITKITWYFLEKNK